MFVNSELIKLTPFLIIISKVSNSFRYHHVYFQLYATAFAEKDGVFTRTLKLHLLDTVFT